MTNENMYDRSLRSRNARSFALACLAVLAAPALAAAAPGGSKSRLDLREGWQVQTSSKVSSSGATIAGPGFKPEGWYPAIVPSTVVGTQVASGEFKDPFRGMNLRKIPGTNYPIGLNSYNNLPMPKDS